MANLQDIYFTLFQTFENLIEQCFATGLMRIEVDRKKKKMLEIDYINEIKRLNDELKKKDLRMEKQAKVVTQEKLKTKKLEIKYQGMQRRNEMNEEMMKQTKDAIKLLSAQKNPGAAK